jgi:hypothetical protein
MRIGGKEMRPVSSLRVKILLALFVAFSVAMDAAAQSLEKIELKGTKPRARSGHAMVNLNGRIFMYGGFNGALPPDKDSTSPGDISAQNVYGRFDGVLEYLRRLNEFIKQPDITEQKALAFFDAAVDEKTGEIFSVFGEGRNGFDFLFNTAVHTYKPEDGNKWTTTPADGETLPSPRILPSVVRSGSDNIIAGGFVGANATDEVLKHDGVKYSRRSKMNKRRGGGSKRRGKKKRRQTPNPNSIVTAAEEEETDLIYIIGGTERTDKDPTGDILIYDVAEDKWIEEESQITAQVDEATRELLARHSATSVEVGNTLYLFGGRGKNRQLLDDIIKVVFNDDDTITAERLAAKFPAGFASGAGAVVSLTPVAGFEASNLQTVEILIFGGFSGGRDTDDAFIFTDIVEVENDTPPQTGECADGPEVSSLSIGGKTKIKGNGFLEGLFIRINGVGFAKAPNVTPKKVTQKGKLENGQSAAEACASGCDVIITNGDGKCTKVAAPQP